MFLLRQRLFLCVIAVASTAWIIVITESAHGNGKPTPPLGMLALLGLVCGAGTAVATLLPAFVVHRRWFTPPPGGGPEPDEHVLLERGANHSLDGEARGGRLFVTERRLTFRPHRYNFQLAPWSAPWESITGFATAPPNFFLVELRDGAREQFVVEAPDLLFDALMELPQVTARDRKPVPPAL